MALRTALSHDRISTTAIDRTIASVGSHILFVGRLLTHFAPASESFRGTIATRTCMQIFLLVRA